MSAKYGQLGPVKAAIRRVLLWRTTDRSPALTRQHLNELVARAGFPARGQAVSECLRQIEGSGAIRRVEDGAGQIVVVRDRVALARQQVNAVQSARRGAWRR